MSFDPSDHPRASTGQFTEKTGASPEVSLTAPGTTLKKRPSRSRTYMDLNTVEDVYSAFQNHSKSARERSDRALQGWVDKTFSGDAATRIIELVDEDNFEKWASIASKLPRGQESRTPNGFKRDWRKQHSNPVTAYTGGQPDDTYDADATLTFHRTSGGTVTIKSGAHALIAVDDGAKVRIVFEEGARGKVISASDHLELVAPAEVESYGYGERSEA